MAHETSQAERAAALALAVTVVLTAAKVAVWLSTSSLAVLSQALDSAVDIVALGLIFVGVRIGRKPADDSHHYGHAKAENLVAFTQMLILGAIVLAVAGEALLRLKEGEAAAVTVPWYALGLLAGSTVVDAGRVALLARAAKRERSEALRSGVLHVAMDIGTAAVALASLLLVRAGFEQADAVGALLVAVVVAVAATRVGRRSVDVLMDRAPGAPFEAIERAASSAAGVEETRRVRVRTSGDQVFADVTVAAGRTASLERAHDIAEDVEREIERVAPGTDVVVHVEPVSETTGLVERVQAAASRTPGVHEVHNVIVLAFDEGGRRRLQATLHAKVRPGLSLAEAHELSDRVEAAVVEELGPLTRVDTHLEPLERTTFGRDVTDERADLVAEVQRAALVEPEVLDCHEVLITSTTNGLTVVAHVRGRSDLALVRIHEASERIENGLRSNHPEIASVLIHFEPT
jgi:cation diffusion facilitator family transporter